MRGEAARGWDRQITELRGTCVTPYERMTHAELMQLRNSLPDESPLHALIAPYEHQAFAREYTKQRGWGAVPSLMVAIPGYTAAKGMGMIGARSPASLTELVKGYKGMGQGIAALLGVK